jgi:aldose 1-epimerase
MYARDDEGIPSGELVSPPPGPWDDCFVNTEPVELHYAELTVTVTSDCDHWVVYDEPSHATCVEPQSGPPDAFNLRPRLLQPGERLIRTMTIQWIDRRWGDRLASHDRATMR